MEQHPDWCLHIPGRENVTSRSQCVLDMGLSAVQEYLFERMSGLIREAKLAYIKWDMNRSITNARSMALPPHRQGREVWHRYILGGVRPAGKAAERFPAAADRKLRQRRREVRRRHAVLFSSGVGQRQYGCRRPAENSIRQFLWIPYENHGQPCVCVPQPSNRTNGAAGNPGAHSNAAASDTRWT